jgi:hypothetical protein
MDWWYTGTYKEMRNDDCFHARNGNIPASHWKEGSRLRVHLAHILEGSRSLVWVTGLWHGRGVEITTGNLFVMLY